MNHKEQLIEDIRYVIHCLGDEGYQNNSEPVRNLYKVIKVITIMYGQLYYAPNLLEDFWQQQSDACPLEAGEMEKQIIAFKEFTKQKLFLNDTQ